MHHGFLYHVNGPLDVLQHLFLFHLTNIDIKMDDELHFAFQGRHSPSYTLIERDVFDVGLKSKILHISTYFLIDTKKRTKIKTNMS